MLDKGVGSEAIVRSGPISIQRQMRKKNPYQITLGVQRRGLAKGPCL